ncbi:MAG TPA: SCP2 sterol-binding domain-containing protein [Terriglobales bacterium]|nr:SCP2 sterol-binding domain-containing protein [Terriglobales bacterium]
MAYPFLSDEWIDAFLTLQADYRDRMPAPQVKFKLNQEITGAPYGEGGVVKLHIDTTSGQAVFGRGHIEAPDTTVSLDYATAKALLVAQDQQQVMQAFMQGKIKVQGDMSKIMVPPPPKNDAQKEFDQKVKDLTEA